MDRKLQLFVRGGELLGLGLVYALWVRFTDLAIPCLFHAVTGWLCPGCGVTKLCLALLQLDLAEAWEANTVLFLMLPVLAVLGIRMAVRYVRGSSIVGPKWEEVFIWIMIALLIVWGVVRNLPL